MNATLSLLLFASLIFGLSVSANEFTAAKTTSFQGESEHWSGTFTAEIPDGEIALAGKLKYKGQDLDSLGQVLCTFETAAGKIVTESLLAGSTSINAPIGEKGTIESIGIGGNKSLMSKTEVVKVTVKWDGKSESFDLRKQ